MRSVPRFMILAAAVCVLPLSAGAQPYVQAPCAAPAPPPFQDEVQAKWYRRFWTGDCHDLPLRCFGGKPNWNDTVNKLVSRAAASQRAAVTLQACRLGREIGFEWSRPNTVRKIDTNDLQALNRLLQKTNDVSAGLMAVEAQVRAAVSR